MKHHLHFLFRADKTNVGDWWCVPIRYFPFKPSYIGDILNKSKKNETVFLRHLNKIIDNKITNAEHMINKFSNNEDLSDLYDK